MTLTSPGKVFWGEENQLISIQLEQSLPDEGWPTQFQNNSHSSKVSEDTQLIDTDAGGIVDSIDSDNDNDGALDIVDAFPLDSTKFIDESKAVRLLLRNSESNKWRFSDISMRTEVDSNYIPLSENSDWLFQAYSDFNGDGEKDILIRHQTSGQWYAYLISNEDIIDRGYIRITSTWNWELMSSSDFNGDGLSDLLLRHKDGHWILYFLEGRTVTSYVRPALSSVTDWQFKGASDFNGDGKADVVIQHSVRKDTSYIYLLDDGEIAERGYIRLQRDISIDWEIVKVVDMDGDALADIIKRNPETGEWAIQYMNGRNTQSTSFPNMTDGGSWHISEVADFNADGEVDILLRNSNSGSLYQYFYEVGEVSFRGYLDVSESEDIVLGSHH